MERARKSDLVDIACMVVAEREKAVAVTDGTTERMDNGRSRLKWFWLPRSQVEIEPDGKGWIATMPMWLAKDKGLI